jgi:hypothetical protein
MDKSREKIGRPKLQVSMSAFDILYVDAKAFLSMRIAL